LRPGRHGPGPAARLETPGRLALNHWALTGDWTAEDEAAVLNRANGQIAYRFRARDLNLILAPPGPGSTARFQVRLAGQPPVEAHGGEITFPDSGVRAYAFTFG
jgi:hypothetical protein